MQRTWLRAIAATLMIIVLSACMYPQGQRQDNQTSPRESIARVQSAVDEYYRDDGMLPIKNFDTNTPLYERYVIDFERLLERQYLSSIPAEAFENGGRYYFVLVDVEHQPAVKLVDLVVVQSVGRLENDVAEYERTTGQLPLGERVNGDWHRLDLSALGMERSPVTSVFSGMEADILLHRTGRVAVDYATDLMMLIQREELTNFDADLDLRELLVEHSYYVPVKSGRYSWQDDRPVIVDSEEL